MTDGEGLLPNTFPPDLQLYQHQPNMMMFQENKQNLYSDPNNMFMFNQFAGNQHIPFQQLQPRGSSLTPRGTVIRTAPAMHSDGRRGYDEIDCVPSKVMMGGVCFPPSGGVMGEHHGFFKSSSDSQLFKKQMDIGDGDLDRIRPEGEFTMSGDSDGSKQIITEEYGIDIFQKDEKPIEITADSTDTDKDVKMEESNGAEMTPSPEQEEMTLTKDDQMLDSFPQRECSGRCHILLVLLIYYIFLVFTFSPDK